MIETDKIIDELIETDPVTRIKEELPEVCSFVAIARLMCKNDRNKDEVIQNMSKMVDSLLTVPVEEILPSLAQRKGSEAFLVAVATYTDTYKSQLDEKTKQLANSCIAFKQAYDDMENIKQNVMNKYKTTLMEFEDIVKCCKGNAEQFLGEQEFEDLIGEVVDNSVKRRNCVKNKKEININTNVPANSNYDKDIPDSGRDGDIRRSPLIRQTAAMVHSNQGFDTFFMNNNSPIISATVDATTGISLASGILRTGEEVCEDDEDGSIPDLISEDESENKENNDPVANPEFLNIASRNDIAGRMMVEETVSEKKNEDTVVSEEKNEDTGVSEEKNEDTTRQSFRRSSRRLRRRN